VIVSQKVKNIILSPSPTVILSRAKNLGFRLRVDSAKDLIVCLGLEILRFA
jgi:hypothetical protein